MNKEIHYDIVVVGAGPAGSSAAFQASKNGAKVALLEKEESVAETVRTSGVTWIQNIKEFGIPDDCFNPIKNYSFCSPNNEVTIRDSISPSCSFGCKENVSMVSSTSKRNME